MGQYIFDASQYDDGVLLSDLPEWAVGSPTNYMVVALGGGRKVWEVQHDTNFIFVAAQAQVPVSVETEVLLLADYTADELSMGVVGLAAAWRATGGITSTWYRALLTASTGLVAITHGSNGNLQGTNTTDDTPTGFASTKAIGMRLKATGTQLFARTWAADVGGLEAAEPAGWDFQQESVVATLYAPTICAGNSEQGSPTRYSVIGLGTDGDEAPFFMPTPTVITPSGLNVTNIGATSATLNWT